MAGLKEPYSLDQPDTFLQLAFLALLFVSVWILWKLFRGYAVWSPLDDIPGPLRSSLWSGNLHDLFNRHGWDFHAQNTEQYGAIFKFHGLLGSKGLYVFDPKALNSIVGKDQAVYEEPEWFLSSYWLVFGTSLVSTVGEHHRRQRKLLNPVFHINHMRQMTPLFYCVVHRLRDAVAADLGQSTAEVNMVDWMGRTALELIGQGGLGYSFDSLVSSSKNLYGEALKELHPTLSKAHLWRRLAPYIVPYVPSFVRRAAIPYLPILGVRRVCEISQTMDEQSKGIFYDKRAAFAKGNEAVVHQIGEGRDVMSILMKANMQVSNEDKLSDEELLGQMSLLVFAATDTTSNALARTFAILAEHQDAQDQLRAEILDTSHDGEDIPYDTLIALPYLDAVCRETLRLHSPVNAVMREAREDKVLPLSEPVRTLDGRLVSEIPVPKGTSIYVGIRACNRNQAIWGNDALEWKPECWLAPLPDAIGNAHIPGVYSNLMTFLGGRRACLGFKFSQLEMKVVLAIMLRSFKFSLCDKEIYWNMATVNYPTVGKLSPKTEMYLKLERVL